MDTNKKNEIKKGYFISEQCVGCGSCKVICPKHCISKGKPYTIHQDKCIKCGLCVKRCWRSVIEYK